MALLVGAIALVGSVAMFWLYISHYERIEFSSRARMRAEEAVAVLQDWVLNAAVGVSADKPSKAFPGVSTLGSWNDLVEVVDSSRKLRLVYGVPSGITVISVDRPSVPPGEVVKIEVTDPLPADLYAVSPATLKGWLVFPSGNLPLRIDSVSGKTLSLSNPHSEDVFVVPFDEVFYPRALVAEQKDGQLYVEDVSLGAPQPRTGVGYADIRFLLSQGVLTLHVLSRGDGPGRGLPSTWPSSFGTSISSDDQKGYLMHVRTSWRLRNR
ncbi:hypothetical protein TheveDRAFT_0748 [Thermanaerovibrio velox DSM 12556]|uniref:Tfp pilus assembly protein PilW n=2 Tax=Thermanaerovibrio TaxID=81461 RepID=H0URG0_9BACT|nr:hypothetical protein TheveDRAFT_0748 [Thermanaerovibrio velox DSM 12556]